MHAGDNNNYIGVSAIEKSVWKPAKKGSSGAAMNDWIQQRMSGDILPDRL